MKLFSLSYPCALGLLWSASLIAGDFDMNQLPTGQSLTLPHQASTSFSSDNRARFSATDLPQSLKIDASSPVTIKIMDPQSPKAKKIKIRPGLPYLYNFAKLGAIDVLPEKGATQGIRITVQSNKPLEVSR